MRTVLALAILFLSQDKEDPRRFLPLVAGNKWTFDNGGQFRVVRKIKPKNEEMFVVEIKTKAYKETVHWQVTDAGIKEYFYRVEMGNEITEVPAHDPIFKVSFPIETGKKWELRLIDAKKNKIAKVYEILAREDIEVPAGKFNALPVRMSTVVNGTTEEETTLWYALDVGFVQHKWVHLKKKIEQLHKLEKYDVKIPKEIAEPPADPAAVSKDLQAGLKEFFDRAIAANDIETANVLGQIYLGVVGPDEAVKKSEEEARKKISPAPVEMDSKLYNDLKEWGKKIHAQCASVARNDKDPLAWQMKGMLLKYAHQHARALKNLNEHRSGCGLSAVTWDYSIAKGSMLHARYLALTGYANVKKGADFHTEDEKSSYFTAEGKLAGQSGVVSSGGIERSVGEWIWSFYHRLGPLHPTLKRTGSGMWDEGIDLMTPSVMDVLRGREGEPNVPWVLYPGPDQTGINPKFSQMGELPNPVEGQDNKTFGQPVTIVFMAGSPAEVKAQLFRGDKEVDCWLHTPEKPSNPAEKRANVICLMPKAHLSGGAKYTVKVSCKLGAEPWSKEWSFTTK